MSENLGGFCLVHTVHVLLLLLQSNPIQYSLNIKLTERNLTYTWEVKYDTDTTTTIPPPPPPPLLRTIPHALTTIYLQIAGREWDRFNKIRIRIFQSSWNYVVITDAVVVSTQSLGLVHVLRKDIDTEWKLAVVRSEYPAVRLRGHFSPWRHFYLHT